VVSEFEEAPRLDFYLNDDSLIVVGLRRAVEANDGVSLDRMDKNLPSPIHAAASLDAIPHLFLDSKTNQIHFNHMYDFTGILSLSSSSLSLYVPKASGVFSGAIRIGFRFF
jgi:hypothetical protein